jgi:hypothetical protein
MQSAIQYVTCLFRDAPPESRAEVAVFWREGKRLFARPQRALWPFGHSIASVMPRYVVEMSAVRYEVFVGVHLRFRVGQPAGKDADVGWMTCLAFDLDAKDHGSIEAAWSRVWGSGLPRPTMIVVSGGGVHVYYCLAPILPREQVVMWRRVTQKYADVLGADAAALTLKQILRPPDTRNIKRGVPVTLAFIEPDNRYSIEQLDGCIAEPETPADTDARHAHRYRDARVRSGEPLATSLPAYVKRVLAASKWPTSPIRDRNGGLVAQLLEVPCPACADPESHEGDPRPRTAFVTVAGTLKCFRPGCVAARHKGGLRLIEWAKRYVPDADVSEVLGGGIDASPIGILPGLARLPRLPGL